MSKRNTFDLKITAGSLKDIHSKYDLFNKNQNEDITALDLENVNTLSFLDDTRKIHKCILSKINFLPGCDYHCFWDRHPIKSEQGLGCPIKFVPSVIHREYFSEINKEKFTVKESLCKDELLDASFKNLTIEDNNYYETDGIFCSLPCMLAFVRENRKNPVYLESETLIHKIAGYKVEPAPHWRLLKVYGGTQEIQEFRDSIQNMEFQSFGTYKPFFKSIAYAYECKIKF
jgi:hypothetical protein